MGSGDSSPFEPGDAPPGRGRWWWVAPVAVTLLVLPGLLVLDLYLWGDLWFAHCAGQDATCGDPPTAAGRRRGTWFPAVAAGTAVLATGGLW